MINQVVNPHRASSSDRVNLDPITLSHEFIRDAQMRGVSPATMRSYDCHLKPFLEYLEYHKIDLQQVTTRDLKNFIGQQLAKNLSPVTVNDYIRTFRHFFKWLLGEGHIQSDPSGSIRKIKEPKKQKRILTLEEVSKLISACSEMTFCGTRNQAMLRLMWDCGLRRGEVLTAQLSDLDLTGSKIGIIGKGNKFASMPFGNKTLIALEQWVRVRGSNGTPYLFVSEKYQPLTRDYLTRMLRRLGSKAGIKVNPHLIRHSVITWLAKEGMNPFDLQAFARHEDLKTTMNYIQRASLEKRLPAEHKRFGPGERI